MSPFTYLGTVLIVWAVTALVFWNAGRRHEREQNRRALDNYVRKYGR